MYIQHIESNFLGQKVGDMLYGHKFHRYIYFSLLRLMLQEQDKYISLIHSHKLVKKHNYGYESMLRITP